MIFVIAGILMLIVEASSPGFFIGIPATIILILGLIGMAVPDIFFTWVSPVIAVGVGVPMTIVTIKVYQRLAPPEAPTTTVGTSLIGRKGVVSKEIRPKVIDGKVTIDHQNWSATAATVIPVGADVVVVESTGVHVTVKEIRQE